MAFRITSEPDKVKWSQPPVPHGETYDGWNEESIYDSYQIAADDWQCDSSQPVTDIHWWGSFLRWHGEDPPQMPDAFHIVIWTDMPIGPDPFSHPDKVVWQTWCDTFTWEFVGWDVDPREPTMPPEACFRFEQDLTRDQWFWQEPDQNIYWVSIAAVYTAGPPADYRWGWKTRPWYFQDDAVRIFDPTAPVVGDPYLDGSPIEYPEGTSWDLAFVLTTTTVGSLTFEPNHFIRDHYWWDDPTDPDNEMISFWVSADPIEPVSWDTVTLKASGTGNDAADIAAVKVWLDNDNDGKVTPGDTLMGTGTYLLNNGQVTIALAPPMIPAGGQISALISYTMNPPLPPGNTYTLTVTDASGTGQVSGQPVAIYGLPLTGATKTTSAGLISIGEAKELTVGDPFILQGKVVRADFLTLMNLFYIEEENRSAGTGVVPSVTIPALTIGDRVYLEGTTFLLNGTELVVSPAYISVTPGDPIAPVGMNNKWTGGGVFGGQPAVVDDAYAVPPKMSVGLNNVGMLIRTWGGVTCSQANYATPSITGDMFWIDDGANLKDGFTCLPVSQPTVGVDVLLPLFSTAPAVGEYYGVTGILRAIPNFSGDPVRLLVPRDSTDMTNYPLPP